MDPRFDFPSVAAVKIIVKRDDKVLLLREPETNDWMPGRLGLPGGKLLLHETIRQALHRKIETEIGFEVDVQGYLRIIQILMPDKHVFHFVFLTEWKSGEIDTSKTESKEMGWYALETIEKLTKHDFTEWYNDELIKDVLNQKLTAQALTSFQFQDNRQSEIADWMARGAKPTS